MSKSPTRRTSKIGPQHPTIPHTATLQFDAQPKEGLAPEVRTSQLALAKPALQGFLLCQYRPCPACRNKNSSLRARGRAPSPISDDLFPAPVELLMLNRVSPPPIGAAFQCLVGVEQCLLQSLEGTLPSLLHVYPRHLGHVEETFTLPLRNSTGECRHGLKLQTSIDISNAAEACRHRAALHTLCKSRNLAETTPTDKAIGSHGHTKHVEVPIHHRQLLLSHPLELLPCFLCRGIPSQVFRGTMPCHEYSVHQTSSLVPGQNYCLDLAKHGLLPRIDNQGQQLLCDFCNHASSLLHGPLPPDSKP
mmetsp:Transcript_16706/g.42476  ORF Transcript_16706/g.42476 Transcript_16706/m.42476 type:complete len:305 (+) Transcript_16706:171-1085(+)